MYLTSIQDNRLRSIIECHTHFPARNWTNGEMALYRDLLTVNARRGALTHEQSLIMAGFAVALVETKEGK